ncbi:rod shape-determining protein MreD [Roseobacter sp. HKCCA0434]|uniref:rod shape-determining protein MreD n=1 Tax=Roseobacter sp. HKCCA0434 TaxID=3079297 RepID=UPI002905D8E3|nr:rod shape-determining protein MreD [Roseobacter sp. HKCCA0434]
MIGAALRVASFVAVMLLAILLLAVPLRAGAPDWPMPDLVMAVACTWVLRRPEAAPMPIIFALGLMADLMLMRPVGLGAFALVVVTEVLRAQSRSLRDAPLVAELMLVALLIAAALAAQVGLIWLTLGNLPPLGELVTYGLLTIAAYPAVTLILALALGLRHRAGGQLAYSSYLGGR